MNSGTGPEEYGCTFQWGDICLIEPFGLAEFN